MVYFTVTYDCLSIVPTPPPCPTSVLSPGPTTTVATEVPTTPNPTSVGQTNPEPTTEEPEPTTELPTAPESTTEGAATPEQTTEETINTEPTTEEHNIIITTEPDPSNTGSTDSIPDEISNDNGSSQASKIAAVVLVVIIVVVLMILTSVLVAVALSKKRSKKFSVTRTNLHRLGIINQLHGSKSDNYLCYDVQQLTSRKLWQKNNSTFIHDTMNPKFYILTTAAIYFLRAIFLNLMFTKVSCCCD